MDVYYLCFKNRNRLAGVPLLVAFFSTRWEWEHELTAWGVALLLCGIGITVRAWGTCHCNYGQGRRKKLTTTGPYAFVRNPLYLGNMSILAAGMVASELIWLLPLQLGWAFLIYSGAIRYEERELEQEYGDAFLRYRERVPAWIPVIHLRGHRFLTAALRQSTVLLVLIPFLMKELHVFHL